MDGISSSTTKAMRLTSNCLSISVHVTNGVFKTGGFTHLNELCRFIPHNQKTTNVHHPSESTTLGLRFCINKFGNSKTSMVNPQNFPATSPRIFWESQKFSAQKNTKHSPIISPKKVGSPALSWVSPRRPESWAWAPPAAQRPRAAPNAPRGRPWGARRPKPGRGKPGGAEI